MTNADATLGQFTAGTATVDGGTWKNSGQLLVGDEGVGTLTIKNGGVVTSSGATIGNDVGSGGSSATVTGVGSTWTNNGSLTVGNVETSTLSILSGGTVSTNGNLVSIGGTATGTGTITVDGAGSSLTGGQVNVGDAGTGTLAVQNAGAVTSTSGIIGNASTGVGTVTVTGARSSWTNSGSIVVGEAGTGTLNILSGASVKSASSIIGDAATGVGVVNLAGSGSSWDDTGDPIVGNAGNGTLNITSGATLTSTVSVLGNLATGNGTVNVDGSGSTWIDNSTITVGNAGTGTLNVANGGLVIAKGGMIVAAQAGSTGTVNLTDSELRTLALTGGSGSAQVNFNNAELTALAGNSAFVSGFSGTQLNIQSGGLTIDNAGYKITAASPFTGAGALTSEGTGTLITTANNTYTGGTTIESGTLAVGDAGHPGAALSGGGATVVNAGATLGGYGSVAGTVTNNGTIAVADAVSVFAGGAKGGFTINGTLINNGLAQVAGAGIGNSLVATNYVGGAGSIVGLNTYLGGDGSPSDLLVIKGGTATGTSGLKITNVGGLGALTTGNGILVVDAINGGTTAASAFRLANFVSAGPYEYTLFRGATDGSSADDWYLRSTLDCALASSARVCAEIDPATAHYRQEVSLYAAVPSMALSYGQSLMDSLHERMGEGEQFQANGANGYSGWARVIAQHGSRDGGPLGIYGNQGPSFSDTIFAFQGGFDLYRGEHGDGSRDFAGLYAAIGQIAGDVTHLDGTLAGRNQLDGYTLGGYWTHFGATGWYLDGVAQGTWSDVTAASTRMAALKTSGVGFASSLEGGYPINLPDNWSIVPQAQLVYQNVSLNDSADAASSVYFNSANSLAGRIGTEVKKSWVLDPASKNAQVLNAWFRADYWQEFLANPGVSFSSAAGPVAFQSDLRGSWVGLRAGVTGQLAKNVSAYASLGYDIGIDNHGDGYNGKGGLRINW